MRIQVETAHIDKYKVIHIWGPSIKDLRECRDQREREERVPRKHFAFDTREKEAQKYIIWWLHDQVVTKNCKTYGEAVRSIVGTTVDINKKFIDNGCDGWTR